MLSGLCDVHNGLSYTNCLLFSDTNQVFDKKKMFEFYMSILAMSLIIYTDFAGEP